MIIRITLLHNIELVNDICITILKSFSTRLQLHLLEYRYHVFFSDNNALDMCLSFAGTDRE